MSGWRVGLVLCIPFVFASSITVIVMALFKVPLDQATACITALAVNAAMDFCLHFVGFYQLAIAGGDSPQTAIQSALNNKGKAVLMDVFLNCLCFAPLMASHFIPIARLGWVMIMMLVACGIGALVIMPVYLPWCVRKVKVVEN